MDTFYCLIKVYRLNVSFGSRLCKNADSGKFLVAQISGAQVHDSRFLIPLVDSISAVKGLAGRARKRSGKLHADRAYASRSHRAWLQGRGVAARIARYGVAGNRIAQAYRVRFPSLHRLCPILLCIRHVL